MKTKVATKDLPVIPNKRYFTIGEVSDLCAVKPHVLRYWEQEFSVLKPGKRRGSRRYYQEKDVNVAREIRTLLYDRGFTINGARKQLTSRKIDTVVAVEPVQAEVQAQATANIQVAASPQNTEALKALCYDLQELLKQLKS